MRRLKFALREYMAPGRTLHEKFENVASISIAGIELTASSSRDKFEEVRKAFEATGVVPAIWSVREGALLDARKEERMRYLRCARETLDMCGELGGVGIVVVPLLPIKLGGRPRIPDLSPLQTKEQLEVEVMVETLCELSEHAEKRNCYLLIEPLNRYEQWHPRKLKDALAICERVGSDAVAILADFFHMNIEEANITSSVREARARIKHVHLADSNRWLPGYGHTEFAQPLRELIAGGYDGFFGFECHIPGDPFVELPKAMDYIEQCAFSDK
ncbi:MAG: sugar phosphate isomerase/epimerase family protein [Armatimonadota bacterium]|nr:sugar phosphate isomerase/epimerase [Armatimonadota bacterium]MCX7778356.1 sugar phosphate isomerase/epimerase [Armatimonadota bacterium]MDW8025124.1 sugar phosphate isomerase/epimerase family protein [Armatimonadota bacterium]